MVARGTAVEQQSRSPGPFVAPGQSPATPRLTLAEALIALLILLLAALLRVAASRGDFWLDEIWSWAFARQASSAIDVFTRFPHDNNHILNTLFLYLLGDQPNWLVYRIPSVVAAIGTVLLAGLIGRRTGRLTALTAMLLTAGSFLLVLYGSEARGYGMAVFFALLSFYLADRYAQQSSWALALLFSLSAVLGLVSHLTYLDCYAGVLVWSVYKSIVRQRRVRDVLADFARCHAIPLAALIALYFGYVRRMAIGGGPPYSLADVLVSTLSLAVGGPEGGRAAVVAAAVASLVLLISLLALRRSHRDQLAFFAVAILLSPALLVLVQRPPALFARYFLVAIVFFLVLASRQLAAIYARGVSGKLAYAVMVLAFLGANGLHVSRLLQYGRGSYLAALRYISEHTGAPIVSVGGDHDFRNSIVVSFYARQIAGQKHVVYYDQDSWPSGGSEWFLIHNQSQSYTPPPLIVARGSRYNLVMEYPFAGLSGWRWFVYHNSDYPS